MTSRREFLQQGALSAVALSLPRGTYTYQSPSLRPPDSVTVQTSTREVPLRSQGGRWTESGLTVTVLDVAGALRVQLSAPQTPVKRVRLRWRGNMDRTQLMLGDAWERGYGDFEWRGFVPDRVMPWYFASWDGRVTDCYGVRTGASALCYWQADPEGMTLCADVRAGSAGVELGERVLSICDVVWRRGKSGESSFAALHSFCKEMCPNPRLPAQPVYGSNDWYWAYGKNSAATVLNDAQHIAELSPSGRNRPFAVIDDGWQPERGTAAKAAVGMWDRGNEKFPDMSALAADIRRAGARPGIWTRPLLAPANAPDAWRLPRDRNVLDPTVPEVRQKIADDIGRLHAWGYELIKHDYTSFDLFGRWGSTMAAAMTRDGWTFASGPTHTTAEVIDGLYKTIRDAAGDSLIIACNTVSHLSAGRFEICRIGDDTSGTEWARTRKMGVNTLAFRGVQHGAFYTADADCVGVTNAVPWAFNRQWLDLLARSGTMLFVSLAPDALGADQRRDLTGALAVAAQPQPLGEPLDWQRTAWPTKWRLMNAERTYDWIGDDGSLP